MVHNVKPIKTFERDVLDLPHADARIQIRMKFAEYFKIKNINILQVILIKIIMRIKYTDLMNRFYSFSDHDLTS